MSLSHFEYASFGKYPSDNGIPLFFQRVLLASFTSVAHILPNNIILLNKKRRQSVLCMTSEVQLALRLRLHSQIFKLNLKPQLWEPACDLKTLLI